MLPSALAPGSPALDEALAALEEKYAGLRALRADREAAEREGRVAFAPDAGPVRIAAFRAIATRFPGALRQLDVFDAAALEARRVGVAAARVDGGPLPMWVAITLDYHALVREALAVKRWLGGDEAIGPARVDALRRWLGPRPERMTPLDAIDAAWVAEHARPPGGKLQALVWRRLEVEHGLSRAAVEALVFTAFADAR